MKAGGDAFLCDYIYYNGEKCQEPAIEGSQFCVLHTPFPEDTEDPEYQRLKEMKEKKAQEKVNSGDFNFEGAILYSFELPVETNGDINFNRVQIIDDAKFSDAKIGGNAEFNGANIGGNAGFHSAEIGKWVYFSNAKIGGDAMFIFTKIGGDILSDGVEIRGNALFARAKIGGTLWFSCAKIGGYAWFDGTEIGGDALFRRNSFPDRVDLSPIHVMGIIDFKDTKFTSPKAQENACRAAKNSCIKFGDNHEADNYFYREMEGKRKQKPEFFRWSEYILVQLIFGYGVKPLRTFCVWFVVILAFAGIYFNFQTLDAGSEFIEYFYFSTTTAMTPGFGGYKISPTWQWLALIEAFFGTFMWAAFITIFARKYMR